MKKTYFLLILILFGCTKQESSLTIAAAANMQFAMEALAEAYAEESGTKIEVILGSSGKLTAQIQQGAPYDLFFSADLKYPNALLESGNTNEDPVIYAQGILVLWSMKYNMPVALEQISSNEVKHIALANPKTAPYGIAAEEVLKNMGLYAELEERLVFGESISQVNQFVTSEAAEMGFTAQSVVVSPSMLEQGNWIDIPDSLYSPIQQAAVILKNDRGQGKEAKAFVDFVLSEKGQVILNKFGYKTQ
ncbi:MAG TPA: molybdate ABC transporter substrate-binding protein [Roseivirga sp.]